MFFFWAHLESASFTRGHFKTTVYMTLQRLFFIYFPHFKYSTINLDHLVFKLTSCQILMVNRAQWVVCDWLQKAARTSHKLRTDLRFTQIRKGFYIKFTNLLQLMVNLAEFLYQIHFSFTLSLTQQTVYR